MSAAPVLWCTHWSYPLYMLLLIVKWSSTKQEECFDYLIRRILLFVWLSCVYFNVPICCFECSALCKTFLLWKENVVVNEQPITSIKILNNSISEWFNRFYCIQTKKRKTKPQSNRMKKRNMFKKKCALFKLAQIRFDTLDFFTSISTKKMFYTQIFP